MVTPLVLIGNAASPNTAPVPGQIGFSGERGANVTFDIVADIAPGNVLKREADIAIRQRPEGSPPAEPDALAMRVGKFGYALYGSRGYVERHGRPERPVRSLAGHEMISTGTFGPGDSWNAQLDEPASVAASIYPLTAVTTAVIAGVGVAVAGADIMTLEDLVEEGRKVQMTEQDQEAQRRSFVYGNTKIENDAITRQTVDEAARELGRERGERRR